MKRFKKLNDDAVSVLIHMMNQAKASKDGILMLPELVRAEKHNFPPISVNALNCDLKNTVLDEWLPISVCQSAQCNCCDGLIQNEMRFLIKNGICIPYYFRSNWVGVFCHEILNVSNSHLLTLNVHKHEIEIQKNICKSIEDLLLVIADVHQFNLD